MNEIAALMTKAIADIKASRGLSGDQKLEDGTYQIEIDKRLFNVTSKNEKVVHTERVR